MEKIGSRVTNFSQLLSIIKANKAAEEISIKMNTSKMFSGDFAVYHGRRRAFFFDALGNCTDLYGWDESFTFEDALRSLAIDLKENRV